MKPYTAAIVAAAASAAIGYFFGLSVGFNGIPAAVVVGAAGSTFGLLVAQVGARAFWLPVIGSLIGLVGIVVVQFGSPLGFGLLYYLFVSALLSMSFTLFFSLAFQLIPAFRHKVFGVRS